MRYFKEFTDLDSRNIPAGMSRRSFLKRVGGGLVIAVTLSDFWVLEATATQPMPEDLNAYLRIGEDGRVSCFTGKIEMGQGINTSLSQMIAEELDVAYESIVMIMGDTDLCPYDRGTWGSMSTRFFGPALRSAAAEARAVLLEMASEKLGEPVDKLAVEDGMVYAKANRKISISYTSLTAGKQIVRSLKGKPTLKQPSEFKIIGKPVLRQDAELKVTGKAIYAGDIRLPGLRYARIVRPPAHDAELQEIDTTAVESIPGLEIVRDNDLVAILHENPDVVDKAIVKIKTRYSEKKSDLNEQTIFDYLLSKAPSGSGVDKKGSIEAGRSDATDISESRFLDGYVAHAPMEPHVATATMEDGKLKIWASTQNPFGVKAEIAQRLSISEENVRVLQNFVGGGFGGKSNNGQAIEAARLAKITNGPVQVAWTRKEEFFYDAFRPAGVVDIKSGVNEDGKITFWDYGVYFAGERGSAHFYDIPNHSTVAYNPSWRAPGVHPFATGAWRAPANNTNSFARESQIDIMAAKAGIDPFEFRMKNLSDERMKNVLKTAADKFGYTTSKGPSGRGIGIACGSDAGAYVAEIAELEVDERTGQVKVKRVVCAQDMGLVINPQGATIQAEGCIIMGMGYALTEDIQFTGGKIHNDNFNDYEIPRFSWIPEIEIELIDAQDQPAQGGGEPAIVIVGAVLANAIYDACGARLHQMPMTPERILQAMG